MTALMVGAALALFSLAIVIHPFLRSRIRSRTGGAGNAAGPASPELEPIFDAINTLQLEYQLGKIPENLYQEQLRGYRLQAASVLRQQAEDRAGAPEWVLEQEVLVARAALRGRDGGPRPCPSCRSLVAAPGLAVCPECGNSLVRSA